MIKCRYPNRPTKIQTTVYYCCNGLPTVAVPFAGSGGQGSGGRSRGPRRRCERSRSGGSGGFFCEGAVAPGGGRSRRLANRRQAAQGQSARGCCCRRPLWCATVGTACFLRQKKNADESASNRGRADRKRQSSTPSNRHDDGNIAKLGAVCWAPSQTSCARAIAREFETTNPDATHPFVCVYASQPRVIRLSASACFTNSYCSVDSIPVCLSDVAGSPSGPCARLDGRVRRCRRQDWPARARRGARMVVRRGVEGGRER